MGSRAAATGDQPDQLQDLGHDDRRQAPARPVSHCPSPMPVRRTMILPLSRSPRRRAVGWTPSRDSGQPHAAASRGLIG
eukprot:7386963-Prymnesium_polylepis.2